MQPKGSGGWLLGRAAICSSYHRKLTMHVAQGEAAEGKHAFKSTLFRKTCLAGSFQGSPGIQPFRKAMASGAGAKVRSTSH